MASVLVTGAGGFIGQALSLSLVRAGHQVRAAVREPSSALAKAQGTRANNADAFAALEMSVVGDIALRTEAAWTPLLDDISTVVHLAARAHVLRERSVDPIAEYRRVNVHGLIELAKAAVRARVRRFVYISSIGVHGTTNSRPFSENDRTRPEDLYAVSKLEAEDALRAIVSGTGLQFVIIRPPLVYGPGVVGNFRRLLQWVDSGWPLPFGAVQNRRSFICLDNLVSLLMLCTNHPAAAGEIFLAADGEDLSTTDLIERLASALGKKARLVSMPPRILAGAARLFGQSGTYARLCGSLMVDSRKARHVLNWSPPVSVEEGLKRTARWYLESCGR